MILFEKIRLKNFFSVGNNFEEIDLISHKTTLLMGKNGEGKSTTIDAVHFALFGKSFRDIKKPLMVNSINGKNMCVELYFSKGSKNYKIIRGHAPIKFEIYEDDVLLNQDAAARDYQEYLETVILDGLNDKVFKQVVVLGSANYTPFMQLSTANRREVIEELLDIRIFSNISELVKNKLSWYRDVLKDLDRNIEIIEQKILIQKNTQKKLQADNSDKKLEYQKHIQDQEELIKKCQHKLELLEKEKESFKVEDVKQYQDLKQKAENNLVKFQVKFKENNNTIDFFEKNCSCSTCRQEITEEHRNSIINPLKEKIPQFEEAMEQLKAFIKDYNEKIDNSIKTEKALRDIQLKIINETHLIDNARGMISHYNQAIQKLEKDVLIESGVEDLKKFEQELIEEKQEKSVQTEDKKYYDSIAILLKDGGIKTKIVKQYIPVMNKIINDYLTVFGMPIEFTLDEQFNETVKSRYRDTFSYNSFSEGEKQRIDLAILLAWRDIARSKNTTNCNLLIFDEIFDSSLDNDGIEAVLDIFSKNDNNSNIFVISHKGEEYFERFERIIEVKKQGNFSHFSEKYS